VLTLHLHLLTLAAFSFTLHTVLILDKAAPLTIQLKTYKYQQ